ncbi:hypothetical protein [Bifidobacterium aemilianum]|uniref:hypothetical protein n=1 Tax=Bifidobacterium aemilianum TaxID=2493120 RepID=UPI001F2DBA2E|nr:hypothetical protein [Bifidobacterium aemilianum]
MAKEELRWYLNTQTGQPELGMLSPATQRMGPYRSREAALKAWRIADRRNDDWEEEDRRWRAAWEGDEETDADMEQGAHFTSNDGDSSRTQQHGGLGADHAGGFLDSNGDLPQKPW